MGYSLFWLAVKGKSPDAVRTELKLRATGEREDVPESPVTGVELPGGWYVVLDNKSASFGAPSVLARLSRRGADWARMRPLRPSDVELTWSTPSPCARPRPVQRGGVFRPAPLDDAAVLEAEPAAEVVVGVTSHS